MRIDLPQLRTRQLRDLALIGMRELPYGEPDPELAEPDEHYGWRLTVRGVWTLALYRELDTVPLSQACARMLVWGEEAVAPQRREPTLARLRHLDLHDGNRLTPRGEVVRQMLREHFVIDSPHRG